MGAEKSRLVLFGSTELTQLVADKLLAMGIVPVGVVTISQEFNISYSKTPVHNVRYCDMERWAKSADAPCLLATDSATVDGFIKRIEADIGLIIGWYHIVKPSTRQLLKRGCIGIHASLLPELRGGAPLNWAILSGQQETGVTLFEMTDEIDDGPVYVQQKIPLTPETNIGELLEKCQQTTLELMNSDFQKIIKGELKPRPQTGEPSYSLQRIPEDGKIDWKQSALEIDRLVRAVSNPYPGAFTFFDNQKVIIWRTGLETGSKFPQIFGMLGQIINLKNFNAPLVVTSDGAIAIKQAEFENGKDALPMLRKAGHQRFDNSL